ncbi:MAG: restriction endonuclease subunit S [Candidatus Caldatribacterium sp.]|nr:restriction endonuclease subunit S [Candidatus Caldatribacterium sp.]
MTEGPYKLPEGWRWVKLGEVCDHKTGIWGSEASLDRGFPIVRSTEIVDYRVIPATAVVREVPPEKAMQYKLEPGDILVNKSSGSPHLVGWPAIFEDPADGRIYLFSNFMLRLRPQRDRVDPWFLLFWLHSPIARSIYLAAQDTTSGLRNLRVREFISLPIPLPPLPEQQRIVARIEELMARVREARRLRQEAKEDAERLWQSVLAETFPRPTASLPEGWRWVRLGEVAHRRAVTLKPSDYPDSTFSYIGMEHITPGQWEQPIPVTMLGCEIKSQVVKFWPGLVLYGKLRPYLNKVVVPTFEGVASTEFVPIEVDTSLLSPAYLGAFLRSPSFVAYANRNITGSRQPRVRLDALWNALIPLPPLPEQRRIVARLEAVRERIQTLKKAQDETETHLKELERSILDKAFRGEL